MVKNITFNFQLDAERISFKWQDDWKNASLLQYLACQTGKLEKLELLLNYGYVCKGISESKDEITKNLKNPKNWDEAGKKLM